MNIIPQILYSNKYDVNNSHVTKSSKELVTEPQKVIDDAVVKFNSKMAYSYGIAQISMKGNTQNSNNINDYYDINKWAFYDETLNTKQKEVEPLKLSSEEDYMTLINDLEKSGIRVKLWDNNDFRQKKYYPDLPDKFIGLLQYCGISDYSLDINKYRSGRKVNNMAQYNPQVLNKLCSVLDYSLKELDKDFGKYNGIVYRFGFFDTNIPQYFSTSMEPKEKQYADLLKIKQEINKKNNKPLTPDLQIHIIKTKNGHKIYDFQKQYLSPDEIDKKIYSYRLEKDIDIVQTYLDEQEVLLPESASYKEIYDDNKLNEKRKILAQKLLPYCMANGIESWGSVEEIADHIKIWEEIEE